MNRTASQIRGEIETALGPESVVPTVNVPEEHAAAYFHDGDLHSPDYAVLPRSVSELCQVMEIADRYLVDVVPWGGGTNRATGAIVAPKGSLVVCTQMMNKVLEVDEVNHMVSVQAGITIEALNRELRKRNLWWPHDPESKINATVGGSISVGGIGTFYCKYGTATDMVSAVTVVLPGGKVIRTGRRVSHSSVGYDFLRVLTSSEGTLGIIAEATLRVDRVPERREYNVVLFDDVERAGKACATLLDAGLRPEALFIDDKKRYCHTIVNIEPGMKEEAEAAFGDRMAAVIISFSGSRSFVGLCTNEALTMLTKESGKRLGDDRVREAWWRARSGILKTELDLGGPAGPAKTVARVFGSVGACVPMEALSLWQKESEELALKHGIVPGGLGAYVGVSHDLLMEEKVFFDKRSRAEVEGFLSYVKDLSKLAVDMGGTIAGTQGVGTKHLNMVDYELRESVEIERELKRVFDPKGIMNRGKKLK